MEDNIFDAAVLVNASDLTLDTARLSLPLPQLSPRMTQMGRHFAFPTAGASHYERPLNFAGTEPVRQHGNPEKK